MEAKADIFLEQIAFDNVCRSVSEQSLWLRQTGCGFDISLAGICIFVNFFVWIFGSAAVMDGQSDAMQGDGFLFVVFGVG